MGFGEDGFSIDLLKCGIRVNPVSQCSATCRDQRALLDVGLVRVLVINFSFKNLFFHQDFVLSSKGRQDSRSLLLHSSYRSPNRRDKIYLTSLSVRSNIPSHLEPIKSASPSRRDRPEST